MKDFIAVLKYCRQKEIKKYRDKQYTVSNNFKCYRKFYVNYKGIDYNFAVACEYLEIKFYIIKVNIEQKGDTPYYYSIEEIYSVLNSKKNNTIVAKILNTRRNKKEKILFDGSEYYFNFFKLDNYLKKLDNDCIHLLLLLCLIQEKSNFYFGDKSQYCEGIVRLINVLLVKNKNHQILLEKGWIYDNNNFLLENPNYVNAIILKFDSKNKKMRITFKELLNKVNNKDDLIKLFFETFQNMNKIKLSFDDCMKKELFKKNLDTLKENDKKLYSSIIKLSDCEKNYEKSYTKEKPIYLGVNIHYILRINSPAKNKYYLTYQEKKDIMKG